MTASAFHTNNQPAGFQSYINFATAAEQAAFVARFPKWVKVKTFSERRYWDRDGVYFQTGFHVRITPDKSTGAANEAGVKRIRKFVELARAEVEGNWTATAINSYPTIDAFLAAL